MNAENWYRRDTKIGKNDLQGIVQTIDQTDKCYMHKPETVQEIVMHKMINEKLDRYLDFIRKLKKLRNVIVGIIVGALGTITKNLEK